MPPPATLQQARYLLCVQYSRLLFSLDSVFDVKDMNDSRLLLLMFINGAARCIWYPHFPTTDSSIAFRMLGPNTLSLACVCPRHLATAFWSSDY